MRGGVIQYKEEYCDLLVNHLSKGLSLQCFGGTVGVSRATVYDWIDRYPEFKAAKEEGVQKAMQFHEEILSAKLSGRDLKGFDPKKSDTTALIFALKTRFHEVYGDKQKIEASITPAFKIVEFDEE